MIEEEMAIRNRAKEASGGTRGELIQAEAILGATKGPEPIGHSDATGHPEEVRREELDGLEKVQAAGGTSVRTWAGRLQNPFIDIRNKLPAKKQRRISEKEKQRRQQERRDTDQNTFQTMLGDTEKRETYERMKSVGLIEGKVAQLYFEERRSLQEISATLNIQVSTVSYYLCLLRVWMAKDRSRASSRKLEERLKKADFHDAIKLKPKRIRYRGKKGNDMPYGRKGISEIEKIRRQNAVDGVCPPKGMRRTIFPRWQSVHKIYRNNPEAFQQLQSNNPIVYEVLRLFFQVPSEPEPSVHITMPQIANMMGVSRQRVHQIINEGLECLEVHEVVKLPRAKDIRMRDQQFFQKTMQDPEKKGQYERMKSARKKEAIVAQLYLEEGKNSQEIADILGIKKQTVVSYVRKFQCRMKGDLTSKTSAKHTSRIEERLTRGSKALSGGNRNNVRGNNPDKQARQIGNKKKKRRSGNSVSGRSRVSRDESRHLFQESMQDPQKQNEYNVLKQTGLRIAQVAELYFEKDLDAKSIANTLGIELPTINLHLQTLNAWMKGQAESKTVSVHLGKLKRRIEREIRKREQGRSTKPAKLIPREAYAVNGKLPPSRLSKTRWSTWQSLVQFYEQEPDKFYKLKNQHPKWYFALRHYFHFRIKVGSEALTLAEIADRLNIPTSEIKLLVNNALMELGLEDKIISYRKRGRYYNFWSENRQLFESMLTDEAKRQKYERMIQNGSLPAIIATDYFSDGSQTCKTVAQRKGVSEVTVKHLLAVFIAWLKGTQGNTRLQGAVLLLEKSGEV